MSGITSKEPLERFDSIKDGAAVVCDAALGVIELGLKDNDNLVRTESIELIGQLFERLGGAEMISQIALLLRDKDQIVRREAWFCLSQMKMREYIALAQEREANATQQELIGIYYYLIMMGFFEKKSELEKLISSHNYQVRSASANAFVRLADDPAVKGEVASYLLRMFSDKILIEKTEAVKSSLRNAIEKLGK